jgi:beta-glucanase (GH16 family)
MNLVNILQNKLGPVFLAAVIVGCGSGGGSDGTVSPVPTPTPTPTPTPSPTPTPTPTPSSDWTLVWSDEFDGADIDNTRWSLEVNCDGGGNDEQQCYTDSSDNAFVENGLLNIVAMAADSGSVLPYTSARLRTLNKGDWTYGRFEIRAKLPAGQGSWPAIWMLPTDWVYGGWAASGEIDIMEAVNLKTQSDAPGAQAGELESRVHGTLHYGKEWPNNVYSGASYQFEQGINPADDFHRYALEWDDGEIRWYVDDVHYATQRDSGWYSQYVEDGSLVNGSGSAPFNQKFHMLLNLAVGGNWPANVNDTGIDPSVFPQSMLVDYVRVYECPVDPVGGSGCATLGDGAELVNGNIAPLIVDADNSFAPLPEFYFYDDVLADGLLYASYNPDGSISYQQVDEAGRGKVLHVTKTGANGNVYFEYSPHADLSHWQEAGELVFDLKLISNSGADLLVKLDSGWPNASDVAVSLPALDTWSEVRISLATLIAAGNRYAPGSYANISDVVNLFVIEPTGAMELQLDNIRLVVSN